MEIVIKKDYAGALYVKASGKLDIDSSAEYGTTINDALDDDEEIKDLVLDFADITYIASIGLRVLLELFQRINKDGSIKIINAQEQVLNVLKMTGFDKFLKII